MCKSELPNNNLWPAKSFYEAQLPHMCVSRNVIHDGIFLYDHENTNMCHFITVTEISPTF